MVRESYRIPLRRLVSRMLGRPLGQPLVCAAGLCAAAWGVNALLPAWGYSYGYSYANPYYEPVESAQPVYDYSQPIVLDTYNSPSAEAASDADQAPPQQAMPETPRTNGELPAFRSSQRCLHERRLSARAAVRRAGDPKSPKDPVLHEFNALCLFALGDYGRAAGVLNSLLAVAPGMDWTTMSSLYPNVDVYTQQLRALETYCRQKAGRRRIAVRARLPLSRCGARRIRGGGPEKSGCQAAGRFGCQAIARSPNPRNDRANGRRAAGSSRRGNGGRRGSHDDLVGKWKAERDGNVFELTVDESGKFIWKATPKGKQPLTIDGNLTTTSDMLILESKDQGSMVGNVTPGGPNQFQFVSTGSPPGDKGLTFKRT